VVKSINIPGRQSIESRFYYPSRLARNMLLIKVKQGQTFSRGEMITTLKKVSNKLSLFSFTSLDEYKERRLFSTKATAYTTIALTLLTLLLSAIGLYGILSYSTQMRRFEIGTHLAVGAKRSDIIKLIIKDNAHAIVMGVMTSLVWLLMLSYLFKEQLTDYVHWQLFPLLLMTIGLICAISFIACYLPLRQYINNPALYSLQGAE
jgi:ABC-type antimicrobial peptide transport system permease subunit